MSETTTTEGTRLSVFGRGHKDIRAACTKETSRYNLTTPWAFAHGGGAMLVASEGRMLAVRFDCIGAGEASGAFPLPESDAPDAAWSWVRYDGEWAGLGGVEAPGLSIRWKDRDRGKFPDFRDCLPMPGEGCAAITLNARLLLDLATALGATRDVVTIFVPAKRGDPIAVVANVVTDELDDRLNIGALMPVSGVDHEHRCRAFGAIVERVKAIYAGATGKGAGQ